MAWRKVQSDGQKIPTPLITVTPGKMGSGLGRRTQFMVGLAMFGGVRASTTSYPSSGIDRGGVHHQSNTVSAKCFNEVRPKKERNKQHHPSS
ncbi:transmembrane efflux protein [Anopheles sinensis]|uniref:Transmembrane efflux protein n=1 Tax=Anopheles sinensis TaxID=74873 RepID=A0A084VNV5_ANOSI|nr:transmembrane efflux protein [Anopheles sinensis]